MGPQHWVYDASLSQVPYDPSLAIALLGTPGSGDQLGNREARIAFTCLVPRNFALLERLALVTQKQLYDVGVDMSLESVPIDEFNRRLVEGRFDAAILDLIGGPSIVRVYQFWLSPNEKTGMNLFGYSNPTVDRWLLNLRHAPDDNSYRAAAVQLQKVMAEDPPALFIAWNERTRAVNRRFVVPDATDRDVLFTLREWRASAKVTEN